MSLPIRCTECDKAMVRIDEEMDCCVNAACEVVGYPVEHEPDDPQELRWTDGLEAA